MEKRYKFLDYYAIAASLGVLIALASYLSSGPKLLYAVVGSAVAAAVLVAVFEHTCGYVRTFVVSDDKITEICLGKAVDVAYREDVDRIIVENSILYSRLSFPRGGKIEAPGYVAEKLARDISAWWEVEVKEVWRPIYFLQPPESRY